MSHNVAYFVIAGQSLAKQFATNPQALAAFEAEFLASNPQYAAVKFFDAASSGSAMLRATAEAGQNNESGIPRNYWYDETVGGDGPSIDRIEARLRDWAVGKDVLGIIWDQGQADSEYLTPGEMAEDFSAGMNYVFRRLMDLSGADQVYIQGVGDCGSNLPNLQTGIDIIHRLQQEFPDGHPYATLVSTTYDLPLADSVHLTTQGVIAAAIRMARGICAGEVSPMAGDVVLSATGAIYITIPDALDGLSMSALSSAFRLFTADGTPTGVQSVFFDSDLRLIVVVPENPAEVAELSYASARYSFGLRDEEILRSGDLPVQPFNRRPALDLDGFGFSTGVGGRVTVGTAGHETLSGTAFADFLDDGGGGADVLDGHAGNDTYAVTNSDTNVTERMDEGIDTVVAASSFHLGRNLENLILIGAGSTGSGNELDNRLIGSMFDDILHGFAGNDAIEGGAGNDRLEGHLGLDRLVGEAGDDLLQGGMGEDFLDGGTGWDDLQGEDGDDRIFGDGGRDRLGGGAGADELHGGSQGDELLGGLGDDLLEGEDGYDRLYGEDGVDRLYGGVGEDHLAGGNENDLLEGGSDDDFLDGGAGDDILRGGLGLDEMTGGLGADELRGGSRGDRLEGGDGDDRLYGEEGHDRLDGGGGNDHLSGGRDRDILNGGAGVDELHGDAGNDFLSGGDDVDLLFGGLGQDRIEGGLGNDSIRGNEAADILLGQEGDDELLGQLGEDWLLGGSGADLLRGGQGNDLLEGNGEDDSLLGEEEDDHLDGGDGADFLVGGAGNDAVVGDGGLDEIHGDDGDDVLRGGRDNDRLFGGGGADLLTGDGADDFVRGGGGDDVLIGDGGQDRLYGDGGADIFLFGPNDSPGLTRGTADAIRDFDQAEGDRIDLSALGDLIFVGEAAFSGTAGELRFGDIDSGTLVEADLDGDGAADFAIWLVEQTDLTSTDFIL